MLAFSRAHTSSPVRVGGSRPAHFTAMIYRALSIRIHVRLTVYVDPGLTLMDAVRPVRILGLDRNLAHVYLLAPRSAPRLYPVDATGLSAPRSMAANGSR